VLRQVASDAWCGRGLRPDSRFAFQGQVHQTHRTHRMQGIIFANAKRIKE